MWLANRIFPSVRRLQAQAAEAECLLHTLLAAEFERRGPWMTKFTINGQTYGGPWETPGQEITRQLFCHFPDAHRILELGSLEGGRSFDLAGNPQVTEVVAIEGRESSIARARFIQVLNGQNKVRFIHGNLETANLAEYGRFDAVFCVGLLYHLPEPWGLLARCAAVSPNLYLSTHYANGKLEQRNGYWGSVFGEGGLADPLAGLSPESFWLTLDSLHDLLRASGYTTINVIRDDPFSARGPVTVLACTKH